MKIFEKEELETAFKQMKTDRDDERRKAAIAAQWLDNQIGLRVSAVRSEKLAFGGYGHVSEYVRPDPHKYTLVIEYTQYDNNALERLTQLQGVTHTLSMTLEDQLRVFSIDLRNEQGFGPDDVYDGTIQYYDAHSCGF